MEIVMTFIFIAVITTLGLIAYSSWHNHRQRKIDEINNRNANFNYDKNNELNRKIFKGLF